MLISTKISPLYNFNNILEIYELVLPKMLSVEKLSPKNPQKKTFILNLNRVILKFYSM